MQIGNTLSMLLVIVQICLYGAVYGQARAKTNLRAFINSGSGQQLAQGRGFYVEPGDSEVPDELRYGTISPVSGVAIATDGTEVSIEGRYDREGLAVQVLYLNKVVNLEGVFFPYVRLSGQTLAYIEIANEGAATRKGYAVLKTGTSVDQFRGYTTYTFGKSSNPPTERGIIPATTSNKMRIDSNSILGGLSNLEIELPRRERWLLPLLDACSIEVMKNLPIRYRADDPDVLEVLVTQLNEHCGN